MVAIMAWIGEKLEVGRPNCTIVLVRDNKNLTQSDRSRKKDF